MADTNNLFPDAYENEETVADEIVSSERVGYRPGIAFNYTSGDFIRDGRNRLLESTGVESWQQWCVNCIQTERYKHLAYNSDFGIDLDAVFAAASRAEAESILTREINDAIMADPYERTAYIDSIQYSWQSPDSVIVTATIVGIDDTTIDITANVTQEES